MERVIRIDALERVERSNDRAAKGERFDSLDFQACATDHGINHASDLPIEVGELVDHAHSIGMREKIDFAFADGTGERPVHAAVRGDRAVNCHNRNHIEWISATDITEGESRLRMDFGPQQKVRVRSDSPR